MAKKIPTSIFSRSTKLFGMAVKVAGKEIKSKVSEKLNSEIDKIQNEKIKNKVEQAKIIAEGLSQLKGAAMKVGQIISIEAADFLPPEAVEILSKLQQKADPVEFSVMNKVIESQLGERRSEVKSLRSQPIAAASIGQVYRAEFEGQPIALKVQYPGVAESIESDVKMVKELISKLLFVSGRKMDVSPTFEEVIFMLTNEANYVRELTMLNRARGFLAASHLEGFIIPRGIEAISSQKVLAMSYEDGISLFDWIQTSPSVESKEVIAKKMLDLFIEEFLHWKLVQTDPNFGNFLIQPESLNIVLLDYGSSIEYEDQFVSEYLSVLRSVVTDSDEEILKKGIEFGMFSDKESKEAETLFLDMLKLALLPFITKNQPFEFSDPDYDKKTKQLVFKFANSLKHTPPPRKILFLHRKLGGLFALLKRLDVKIDLQPYWEKLKSF